MFIITFSLRRWCFSPTEDDMAVVLSKFDNNLRIPNNFIKTAAGHCPGTPKGKVQQPQAQTNPQTKTFCEKLAVDDPLDLLLKSLGISDAYMPCDESQENSINNETFIEDSEILETSVSTDSSLRLRLSLPKPKHEFSEDDIDNKSNDFLEKSLNSIKVIEKDSSISDLDVSNSICIQHDDARVESTRPKKFVRRNADIYKDND